MGHPDPAIASAKAKEFVEMTGGEDAASAEDVVAAASMLMRTFGKVTAKGLRHAAVSVTSQRGAIRRAA